MRVLNNKALSEIVSAIAGLNLKAKNTRKARINEIVNNLELDLSNHELAVLNQVICNTELALDFLYTGDYKNVRMFSYKQIEEIMNKYKIMPVLLDSEYAIMPEYMAIRIMDSDICRNLIYVKELFDCDDFAELFSALIAAQFLINSVGIAYGELKNVNNNELVGYHAFNLIPVIDATEDSIEIYIFEPQTGKYATIDNPVIGGYQYIPKVVKFG